MLLARTLLIAAAALARARGVVSAALCGGVAVAIRTAEEGGEELADEAARALFTTFDGIRLAGRRRCRPVAGANAYQRLLACGTRLDERRWFRVDIHFTREFVAGLVFVLGVIDAHACDFVAWGFQGAVGDQHDAHALALLDAHDGFALFVEQVGGDIDRELSVDAPGVVLHGIFFDHAQDRQCQRLHVADAAEAVAARTRALAEFAERGAQALARHFQQTETGDPPHLYAGAIFLQCFLEAVFHFALIARRGHVDEIDDDQAAEVAQAQLAGDFIRRFQIGLQRGFLDVAALGGATGVDIDRGQRFGAVDDDGAAGG